jgi:hypothetical protein
LHQSLKDVQIIAESVPELKTSLQKSIAASEKFQQELVQLQSNVEASAKSLEVKDRELLLLRKKSAVSIKVTVMIKKADK